MCLFVTYHIPKITTRKKTCYKVFRVIDGMLISVFYPKNYKIGKEYREKPFPEIFTNIFKNSNEYRYVIFGKSLHSCKTIFGAIKSYIFIFIRRNKYHLEKENRFPLVIAKCEIPKDSLYFDGIWEKNIHSYASNKLIVKKVYSFIKLRKDD